MPVQDEANVWLLRKYQKHEGPGRCYISNEIFLSYSQMLSCCCQAVIAFYHVMRTGFVLVMANLF